MTEDILFDVKKVLKSFSGHSFDHVERVLKTALYIADKEGADIDKEVVKLAALLHDTDDYKFVGIEAAKKLTNARLIMQKYHTPSAVVTKVCDIISTMGYSNRMQGIYPVSKEGQIVSDADMLDAMGSMAVVRTLEYAFAKKSKIFDKKMFPTHQITAEAYQKKADGTDTVINHFFDKLLKLKGLLLTDTAKILAQPRHQLMIDFLISFFNENEASDWLDYLKNYLEANR